MAWRRINDGSVYWRMHVLLDIDAWVDKMIPNWGLNKMADIR